ncbi:MAG: N-glycosylase/DNA lyase [Candidatus Aenigmarchaeota archaeon]|nr:N-glycosylase/DNA lyase [Candidatus Aenigmarchaeota archaeon]
MDVSYLRQQYKERKNVIKQRLKEFKDVRNKDGNVIFAELAFCLLTPQSNGRRCWVAIEKLQTHDVLFSGKVNQIKKIIKAYARFHHTKARHIVYNRKFLNGSNVTKHLNEFSDAKQAREWLVKNIKGFGYKEASHFLRNIGYWEDIAILDRHILKNLVKHGAIESLPKSLTPKKYLEIEEKMKEFADRINIPFPELDLLFWSEETGEVFK